MGNEENPFEASSRYVSEGKLGAAIDVLEQHLGDLPATPFHAVIGCNGFLPLAEELSMCLETFARSFAEPRELQAIYLELGELEINPYNWFCRIYGCNGFVNPNIVPEQPQDQTDALPTVPWPESTPLDAFCECVRWRGKVQPFRLEGYPRLHIAFEDHNRHCHWGTPLTKEAHDAATVLLIRRFQQLVAEVHSRAKERDLMIGGLPVIAAGFGDEVFFVSLNEGTNGLD